MNNEIVQTGFFDLELDTPQKTWHIGLEDTLQTTLRQRAAKIKAVVAQANFIIGEELATAQQELTYKNGGFVKWLEEEIGIDFQRAYEFIQIWENYKMFPLSGNISGIGKKVLLAGAKKDVPESARQEIVTRHEAGEKITLATAKEIAEAHKAREKAEQEARQERERAESTQRQLANYRTAQSQLEQEIATLNLKLENMARPQEKIVYEDTPETRSAIANLKRKQEELQNEVRRKEKNLEEIKIHNSKFAEENRKLTERMRQNLEQEEAIKERLRVQNQWRRTTDICYSTATRILGEIPSPIDQESLDGDDWARHAQCVEVLQRVLTALQQMRNNQSDPFVEASIVDSSW